MSFLEDPELVAGFAAAAIVAAALFLVTTFCHLTIAIAATLIIYTFATRGVGALVERTNEVDTLLMAYPMFCKGAALGAITAIFVATILRGRD